jgi:hypothetical protein
VIFCGSSFIKRFILGSCMWLIPSGGCTDNSALIFNADVIVDSGEAGIGSREAFSQQAGDTSRQFGFHRVSFLS